MSMIDKLKKFLKMNGKPINPNYFTSLPSILTSEFVSANLFLPQLVRILQFSSLTFFAKNIPKGLSAVILTFFKRTFETTDSGRPHINPALFLVEHRR